MAGERAQRRRVRHVRVQHRGRARAERDVERAVDVERRRLEPRAVAAQHGAVAAEKRQRGVRAWFLGGERELHVGEEEGRPGICLPFILDFTVLGNPSRLATPEAIVLNIIRVINVGQDADTLTKKEGLRSKSRVCIYAVPNEG